jgi:hypothetical protein
MEEYLMLNDVPFTITGTIRNYGTQPITSYDLNYSINGGATVTQTINTSPIVIFKSKTFSHPTGWSPTAAGSYDNRSLGNKYQWKLMLMRISSNDEGSQYS